MAVFLEYESHDPGKVTLIMDCADQRDYNSLKGYNQSLINYCLFYCNAAWWMSVNKDCI
jgi:hypothetical protein